MSFNFPDTPSVGQTYPPYKWDGEKWVMNVVLGEGYARVFFGDTPPANPADGCLWWHSTQGVLYLRYFDGDSSQWVIAMPQPEKGDTGATGAQGIPGPWTQITQAAYNALSPPNAATLYVIIG